MWHLLHKYFHRINCLRGKHKYEPEQHDYKVHYVCKYCGKLGKVVKNMLLYKPKIYMAPPGTPLPPLTSTEWPKEWKRIGEDLRA